MNTAVDPILVELRSIRDEIIKLRQDVFVALRNNGINEVISPESEYLKTTTDDVIKCDKFTASNVKEREEKITLKRTRSKAKAMTKRLKCNPEQQKLTTDVSEEEHENPASSKRRRKYKTKSEGIKSDTTEVGFCEKSSNISFSFKSELTEEEPSCSGSTFTSPLNKQTDSASNPQFLEGLFTLNKNIPLSVSGSSPLKGDKIKRNLSKTKYS